MLREIVLPEQKPALEWVNGRVIPKRGGQLKHALAQTEFGVALRDWADKTRHGTVGIEWEFRIAPPGEGRRPLVPEVAFLSYESMPYDVQVRTEIARIPPDVVVEILAPGDLRVIVEEKIRVYLACGTSVIFLVNTERQTVTARDPRGPHVFQRTEIVRHDSLPGFAMLALQLFELPRPGKRTAR